jgi:hypothetical protein
VDVVVEVGDWEHECCGQAVERHQAVDFHCLLVREPGGGLRLVETHHHDAGDAPAGQRVQGRVSDLHVVEEDGSTRPILRVPGGSALCGTDDADDGHLEDPWTGEVLTSRRHEFLVTVQVPGPLLLDPSSVYRT